MEESYPTIAVLPHQQSNLGVIGEREFISVGRGDMEEINEALPQSFLYLGREMWLSRYHISLKLITGIL